MQSSLKALPASSDFTRVYHWSCNSSDGSLRPPKSCEACGSCTNVVAFPCPCQLDRSGATPLCPCFGCTWMRLGHMHVTGALHSGAHGLCMIFVQGLPLFLDGILRSPCLTSFGRTWPHKLMFKLDLDPTSPLQSGESTQHRVCRAVSRADHPGNCISGSLAMGTFSSCSVQLQSISMHPSLLCTVDEVVTAHMFYSTLLPI